MSLNNLVLYNTDFVLTRYNSPLEIIKEFFNISFSLLFKT